VFLFSFFSKDIKGYKLGMEGIRIGTVVCSENLLIGDGKFMRKQKKKWQQEMEAPTVYVKIDIV